MDITDFFINAKNIIERLDKTLTTLYSKIPSKAKKEIFGSNLPKLKEHFFLVLQARLFQMVVDVDYHIDYLEALFIADIGDLYTRLDFLYDTKVTSKKKEKDYTRLTYLLLSDSDQAYTNLQDYSLKLNEFVKDSATKIFQFFAVYLASNGETEIESYIYDEIKHLYKSILTVNKKYEKMVNTEYVDYLIKTHFIAPIAEQKSFANKYKK